MMGDQKLITPDNAGVPTQFANPRRASWRTVVQTAIGILVIAVPIANSVLANVSDYLHEQTDVAIAPWVWVAPNAGLGITALVSGVIARIMNTPGVSAFIAKYLPILAPIGASKGDHEA